MKQEHLEYLKELHTGAVAHERGSLFDHLIGTYNYLASWGCEEHICSAGLFHSIYGTNIFRHATITHAKRQQIKDLLGEKAEDLVYLFSCINRPLGLITAIYDGYLLDATQKSRILITREKLGELIEIEAANLMEQGTGRLFFEKLLREVTERNFPMREAIVPAIRKGASLNSTAISQG